MPRVPRKGRLIPTDIFARTNDAPHRNRASSASFRSWCSTRWSTRRSSKSSACLPREAFSSTAPPAAERRSWPRPWLTSARQTSSPSRVSRGAERREIHREGRRDEGHTGFLPRLFGADSRHSYAELLGYSSGRFSEVDLHARGLPDEDEERALFVVWTTTEPDNTGCGRFTLTLQLQTARPNRANPDAIAYTSRPTFPLAPRSLFLLLRCACGFLRDKRILARTNTHTSPPTDKGPSC